MRAGALSVVLMIAFVQLATSQSTTLTGIEGNLELVQEEQVVLQENIEFLAEIFSLAAVPEGGFVVTTRNGGNFVVVYDDEGKQIRMLGRPGQGPYEFEHPSHVTVQGERVLVWDLAQRKLSAFDLDGTPLDEWTALPSMQSVEAKRDFLVLYQSTSSEGEGFIAIYDPEQDDYTCRTGARTHEDRVLERNIGLGVYPGGLALHGDEVLYATPAKERLYRLNPDVCEETVVSFEVPGFSVDEADFDLADQDRAIEYAFYNSRIRGIHPLGRYVVVQAENGPLGTEEEERLLLVFDEEFQHLDTIRTTPDHRELLGRHGARLNDGERLGFLTQEDANGEVQRVLNWWRVQPVE